MTGGKRRIAVLALIGVLGWLGYRWWAGDGSSSKQQVAAKGKRQVPAWQYKDGKMQRIDPGKLAAALKKLKRARGLVRVTGSVRERNTDRGIAGAEVVFASPLGEATASTDDDGHYSIDLQPGFYRAFARASGFVAVGTRLTERVPTAPDLGKLGMPRSELAPIIGIRSDRDGVDMHLFGGGVVKGTVYDEAGRPVPGAIVSAEHLSGRLRAVAGTDVDETGLDGSFRLEVPAGYLKLAASHDDYAGLTDSAQNRVYLSAGDTTTANLTLTEGCIVTGSVVSSEGEPVAEGTLEEKVGGLPPNDWAPVGKLNAFGRFRLTRTDSKSMELRAWPWKSAPTATRTIDCYEGARHEGVVLVTRDLDPDLEGTIVDRHGRRVADAYIDLFPLSPGGMEQQERADAVGEWAFHNLPEGDYHVTAYVPGAGAVATTVTVPSTGVQLQLSGTGTLLGEVKGIENGSFTMVIERCALTTEGRTARFDETSMPPTTVLVPVEYGKFRVDNLPACPIRGRATIERRTARFQVTITADSDTTTVIDLRPYDQRTQGGGIDWDR